MMLAWLGITLKEESLTCDSRHCGLLKRFGNEKSRLRALARQLSELKASGGDALETYVRNVKLRLFNKARRVVLEVKNG